MPRVCQCFEMLHGSILTDPACSMNGNFRHKQKRRRTSLRRRTSNSNYVFYYYLFFELSLGRNKIMTKWMFSSLFRTSTHTYGGRTNVGWGVGVGVVNEPGRQKFLSQGKKQPQLNFFNSSGFLEGALNLCVHSMLLQCWEERWKSNRTFRHSLLISCQRTGRGGGGRTGF